MSLKPTFCREEINAIRAKISNGQPLGCLDRQIWNEYRASIVQKLTSPSSEAYENTRVGSTTHGSGKRLKSQRRKRLVMELGNHQAQDQRYSHKMSPRPPAEMRHQAKPGGNTYQNNVGTPKFVPPAKAALGTGQGKVQQPTPKQNNAAATPFQRRPFEQLDRVGRRAENVDEYGRPKPVYDGRDSFGRPIAGKPKLRKRIKIFKD